MYSGLIGANIIDGKKPIDLRIDANIKLIQSFFDTEKDAAIDNLYSHYFELCYPNARAREDFLTNIIRDKKPSLGHLCIAALIQSKKLHTVWTTNFDDLVEKATGATSCATVSTKDANSISSFREDIPKVVKLHGDFKYDSLQNTDEELQGLETNISKQFIKGCSKKSLIVVGYSGSDTSVMNLLNEALLEDNPFPRGLVWCLQKGAEPSQALISLINKANDKNKCSGFMYIDTFDYFLHELYITSGVEDESIDNLAKKTFELRKPFNLTLPSANSPIMLNAIKADSYPNSFFVVKTDLQGWTELRSITKGHNVVGALSSGETYLLGEEGVIKDLFAKKTSSAIEIKDVPEKCFYQNESFFIGLLYDFIAKSLVVNNGLSLYQKGRGIRKIYSKNHLLSNEEINTLRRRKISIPTDVNIFEAFEYKVEIINKELFLIILPCVHIKNVNGNEIKKDTLQYLSNTIYSNRYNNKYGEKLSFWHKLY